MRAVVFDLDGVLYLGDQPIEGAADAVAYCREQSIPHLFLTNTTSRPRSAIVAKLAKLGIKVDPDAVLTPPRAAADWIAGHGADPVALFVADATASDFERLETLSDDATTGAGSVVVGDLAERWSFATLNRAFRLLMAKPQPHLIALGMTRYWRAEDGLRLDVGAYVSALSFASDVEPVVLGKPARAFFEAALERLSVPAAETLMIGDDVIGDVGAAQAAGLKGMLVRTGKFRQADLERDDITPDVVVDSIAELPEWWRAHTRRVGNR